MADFAFDPDAPKKPTNLSINASLLEAAKQMKINVSKACERGLQMQIAEIQAKRWQQENAEALDSSNAFVEANGLPLAKFRQF
ncbi:type II toxin-antitoxin system CcdA family antitoxin [Magnetospirillum sp. 64-120]|uniref:type II toxin-antitoxin system CcdA family antitoxin n=1 Tax=Magnetospirillum sp. 64-120 TaxID=1895778 RepID=UPI0025C6064D|nr:type II toxin-antitoxin system CcdA family antitoxin [Magnetospirillum sp. 64-120]